MYLDAAEGNPDVSIRFTVVIKYITTPKIPYSSGPKYLPKPKCITYPLSINTSCDTIRYIVPLATDVIRIEILGVYIKILKRDITRYLKFLKKRSIYRQREEISIQQLSVIL